MSTRQFVRHGPHIPTELLQDLEEGRLVFFCGAGISVPTGLPGFKGLTEHAFEKCGISLDSDPAAKGAFGRGEFDKALEILECRTGGRDGPMRRYVAERLTAKVKRGSLEAHRALLALARRHSRPGAELPTYRLVTTNFDTRFERAGLKRRFMEEAPRLSPAHRDTLRNVVFLHGRIETELPAEQRNGRDLVLTTADFGNAYLRFGWAARFVVELFRDFTVLFIGYSINDPVMRYVLDALATETGPDGQFRRAYAFVPYSGSDSADKRRQKRLWQAKNVEPILYASDYVEAPDHGLLRQTLVAWADEYESGLLGRVHAACRDTKQPFQKDTDDSPVYDRVAIVAWALSQQDGKIANAFVDANPHISWLGPLTEKMIRDPRSPDRQCTLLDLTQVRRQIARWIGQNLDKIDTVNWAITREAKLFPELIDELQWKLSPNQNANTSVAEPYASFWRVMVRLASQNSGRHAPRALDLPKNSDLFAGYRRTDLIELLRPCISGPRPPYIFERFVGEEIDNARRERLRDLAKFDVEVKDTDAVYALRPAVQRLFGPCKSAPNMPALIRLADDLTTLILEHLETEHFVDGTGYGDESWIVRPSLTPLQHDAGQVNQTFDYHNDWQSLLEILRICIQQLARRAPSELRSLATRWQLLWRYHGHGLFLRLWLYAYAEAT